MYEYEVKRVINNDSIAAIIDNGGTEYAKFLKKDWGIFDDTHYSTKLNRVKTKNDLILKDFIRIVGKSLKLSEDELYFSPFSKTITGEEFCEILYQQGLLFKMPAETENIVKLMKLFREKLNLENISMDDIMRIKKEIYIWKFSSEWEFIKFISMVPKKLFGEPANRQFYKGFIKKINPNLRPIHSSTYRKIFKLFEEKSSKDFSKNFSLDFSEDQIESIAEVYLNSKKIAKNPSNLKKAKSIIFA